MTAIKHAILKKQPGQQDKKSLIKTLIEEFDYPKLGPGMMWRAMAEIIQKSGSQVCLGKKVEGIRCVIR
jgi:protoporphyrinogen oxidase